MMRLLSSKQGAIFFGKETGRVFNLFILFCEICELAVVCISNGTQLITQLIFLFPVPCSLFPLNLHPPIG